jgi:hypothetical protein
MRWIALAMMLVAACGSDGKQLVSGEVSGKPFHAEDAIFLTGNNNAFVAVTDFAQACDSVSAGQQRASSRVLGMQLVSPTGISIGNYLIGVMANIPSAIAGVTDLDASCNSTSITADAGRVVVTRADATAFEGTFDLTLSTSDHITGHFAASLCMAQMVASSCL